MGGARLQGPPSLDVTQHAGDFDVQFPTGGFEFSGPISMDITPTVASVDRQWDPA